MLDLFHSLELSNVVSRMNKNFVYFAYILFRALQIKRYEKNKKTNHNSFCSQNPMMKVHQYFYFTEEENENEDKTFA